MLEISVSRRRTSKNEIATFLLTKKCVMFFLRDRCSKIKFHQYRLSATENICVLFLK